MKLEYQPKGVCSRSIRVEVTNGIVGEVEIDGGCSGNSKGISALVKGRSAVEAIELLHGICCGHKKTSCPDQLSIALSRALEQDHNS